MVYLDLTEPSDIIELKFVVTYKILVMKINKQENTHMSVSHILGMGLLTFKYKDVIQGWLRATGFLPKMLPIMLS